MCFKFGKIAVLGVLTPKGSTLREHNAKFGHLNKFSYINIYLHTSSVPLSCMLLQAKVDRCQISLHFSQKI